MGNRKSGLSLQVIDSLSKSTNFTHTELNNLYRQYRNECSHKGCGLKLTIDFETFKSIYEEIYSDGDSSKFAQNVFRTFDQDHNGVIDFKELVTLLDIQMKGTYEEKLTWLFDLYDLDNSQEISYDEAYKVYNVLFDLNSGLIPNEEDICPKQLTEFLFKQAEQKRAGKVDRKFFYTVAVESPLLRSVFEATARCASYPFIPKPRKNISGVDRNNRQSQDITNF